MKPRLPFALLALMVASAAHAQLRVVSWNITNYSGGRTAAFQTAIFDSFNGLSMQPDVITVQEVLSSGGHGAFLTLLNSSPNSPGDYAAAPWHNGRDTDSTFYFRTGTVVYLGTTVVQPGNVNENPRDIMRYDFAPVGYEGESNTVSIYSLHMKAGSSSSDQARRLIEAQYIRTDAENLPAERALMVVGDFNIQSSNQGAYQEFIGTQANNDGRVFDPIARPGSWQNNSTYTFVHTQDPQGGGGMDDRYDQILISEDLIDGGGLEYLGNHTVPYSNSTWNDPNHSFLSWGNDGTSYNVAMTTTGNTMVGASIAQAIIDSCGGQSGHTAILLDLLVPPTIAADTVIDLGTVNSNDVVATSVDVSNSANTALWSPTGVSQLVYSFDADPEISAPGGSFNANAGASATAHALSVTAPALAGAFSYELRIDSNTEGTGQTSGPTVVQIIGTVGVLACSDADLTTQGAAGGDPDYGVPDGIITANDINYFINAWVSGDVGIADLTTQGASLGDPGYGVPDGMVTAGDVNYYVNLWLDGCP